MAYVVKIRLVKKTLRSSSDGLSNVGYNVFSSEVIWHVAGIFFAACDFLQMAQKNIGSI